MNGPHKTSGASLNMNTRIRLLLVAVWLWQCTAALGSETNVYESQPGIWGSPTNGIQAGLQLPDGAFGKLYVAVVVMNSGTNLSQVMVFPSAEEGVNLHLEDTVGNRIPRTPYGDSFGKALSDRASIYDQRRPGKAYGRAFARLHPGEPIEIRGFNIKKCFKISQPGEYKLTVEASIYVPSDKGRLKPLTLPPVSRKMQVAASDLE